VTLLAGTRLGPYEVIGLLGAGGMGEVYRARDPRLERDVAVKVLPVDVASDSARLALFEREARAVAALNHPNILTVHDVGTHDGVPYVVTELLEGETFRELASRRTPTSQQTLSYMFQAARGLEAAHAKGIVHRDFKPENLFLTAEGRVKVLDFGLAKLVRPEGPAGSDVSTAARSTAPGQVAGTVLYMSPEQARAQPVDARSDVFSFGVVLFELLAGRHPFRKDTVASTLTAIVEETPPDLETLTRGVTPAVGGIVRRCLQKTREERHASGHDLAVALEAVLAAPSGSAALREVEERSPYPGLSSFTEEDAGHFFGREEEVKALWGRLRQRKLLALIGPSGTGKTSFVHAGVVPACPGGWATLVCTPGQAPMRSLARALAPELIGDAEGLTSLPDFDEADVAVSLVARWREAHGEALVIVDQFEELFTQSLSEVQDRFAALLSRLASEAGVHVLLSLRDDFLMKCHDHAPLAPVFSELTPLGALTREGLRRAVTEPADRQGYRLEDEALVDEMLDAVEGVRGALPLLAFAVSRLWEKRDRKNRRLTREAYQEIGGVAGALAQHAEQTLERIGAQRQALVREIFRNLVTAQGTRASSDREELLSVFPQRKEAEEVLGELIDARLLTSYEISEGSGGSQVEDPGVDASPSRHRIEIVHESLLRAWPRLVWWQSQDEEGAHLRDQLKQAAHLWEEKERSPDLLWSGAAFREFELWRERYTGQLTATEDNFARAMVERARRRRRLRRAAVATVVAGLALVAGVVSVSRHQAVRNAQRAEQQALRAEAGKVLALGRLELENHPTAALAYARTSLGITDTPDARRLALEALWRSPPYRAASLADDGVAYSTLSWSGDGSTVATGDYLGHVVLLARDGKKRRLGDHRKANWPEGVAFAPDGRTLATGNPQDRELRFWSVAGGTELRTQDVGEGTYFAYRAGRLLTITGSPGSPGLWSVRTWRSGQDTPVSLGRRPAESPDAVDLDPRARWLALGTGRAVRVTPLDGAQSTGTQGALVHGARVFRVKFSGNGTKLVSSDVSGEARVWSFDDGSTDLVRTVRLRAGGAGGPLALNEAGTRLAWASPDDRSVSLWGLADPPGAVPLSLSRPDREFVEGVLFGPQDDWLAAAYRLDVALWPVGLPHSRILDEQAGAPVYRLLFAPDSQWLASCSYKVPTRLWPMHPAPDPYDWRAESRGRSHEGVGVGFSWELAVSPDGQELLLGNGPLTLQPIDGRRPSRILEGGAPGMLILGRAIDPTGRIVVAASGYALEPEHLVLQTWNLETGERRTLPLPGGEDGAHPFDGGIEDLRFTPEGTLYSAGWDDVRRWDIEAGTSEVILDATYSRIDLSRDGRRLLAGVAHHLGRNPEAVTKEILLVDLEQQHPEIIESHGDRVTSLALGPGGDVVVTGSLDGSVRVGRSSGEEPHLLLGHKGRVSAVSVSPDGRWIASGGGNEVRLWPMPDLSKPPLHTLPYEELIGKLRALTNVQVVRDEASPTGYRVELGPFPGWKDVPTW
jgi:WD40 repeat protein